jgi:hypothetical protein
MFLDDIKFFDILSKKKIYLEWLLGLWEGFGR